VRGGEALEELVLFGALGFKLAQGVALLQLRDGVGVGSLGQQFGS